MGSTPNNAGSFHDGAPIPQEVVIYGSNGKPVSSTNPFDVDVDVQVNTVTSATAALTSVAGSATSVSILAANTSRKAAYIYNDSASAMYLAYAGTASTSAYTVKIPAGNLFELPTSPVWTGALSAIWDTATGNARITEVS